MVNRGKDGWNKGMLQRETKSSSSTRNHKKTPLQQFDIAAFFEEAAPFVLVSSARTLQQSSWRGRVDFSLTLWIGSGLHQQLLFPLPAPIPKLGAWDRLWIQRESMQRLKEIE